MLCWWTYFQILVLQLGCRTKGVCVTVHLFIYYVFCSCSENFYRLCLHIRQRAHFINRPCLTIWLYHYSNCLFQMIFRASALGLQRQFNVSVPRDKGIVAWKLQYIGVSHWLNSTTVVTSSYSMDRNILDLPMALQ